MSWQTVVIIVVCIVFGPPIIFMPFVFMWWRKMEKRQDNFFNDMK